MEFTIKIMECDEEKIDETITAIDAWYDKHTRLWIIQKLNKNGYQVGDAEYVYGKKDAMLTKAALEREYNL